MADENSINADLAIETVARLRQRGGIGRAVGTVFAFFGATGLAGAALSAFELTTLLYAALSIGCGWMFVRNLRQNSYVDRGEADQIRRLPAPRSAVLIGNRLLDGTSSTPRATWCEVDLSDREVRELRTLALPAARVHDGG